MRDLFEWLRARTGKGGAVSGIVVCNEKVLDARRDSARVGGGGSWVGVLRDEGGAGVILCFQVLSWGRGYCRLVGVCGSAEGLDESSVVPGGGVFDVQQDEVGIHFWDGVSTSFAFLFYKRVFIVLLRRTGGSATTFNYNSLNCK